MPGGPAALAVLLCLLPGWVYWRLEGRPRTTRSSLGELFELVGAGALATGVTVLTYITVAERWELPLVAPGDLTRMYARDHLARIGWSAAVVVAVACGLAALAAIVQRKGWQRWTGDRSTYLPETPLWVSALGGRPETVVTVEIRDGRKVSGYLEGYEVDVDGSPSVLLSPPVTLDYPTSPRPRLGRRSKAESDNFSHHSITIPGDEIIAVWVPYEAT